MRGASEQEGVCKRFFRLQMHTCARLYAHVHAHACMCSHTCRHTHTSKHTHVCTRESRSPETHLAEAKLVKNCALLLPLH